MRLRSIQRWTHLVLRGAALAILSAGLLMGRVSSDEARSIGGVYSPGGWSTLHRGPANRKLVGPVPLAERYASWTVLEGASILTAPVMSPDGQTLYVTTGRARGESNLHAYSIDGELRWRSDPWTDPRSGVDPCAILSSPIVDVDGNLFIGDCNQLFSFEGGGRLRWVVDLPPAREGDWQPSASIPINALTTAAFTREGHVFGVTNFGDVVVYDRADGRQLNAPERLPGHVPESSSISPMPESVFGEGLVDPEIREWAWQLLVGGAMPSANTPAVDLASGRVFVAATSPTAGRGALYGLDLTPREASHAGGLEVEIGSRVEVEVAFGTEMGPGSGSSPSLSPGSDVVYVSDENGRFYGVDAASGVIRWEVETRAASAAAAVGANGDIYALQAYGPALIAITERGQVRWESDLRALAEAALPKSLLLGEPAAIGNGNPTVLGDVVLVPVVYGYETTLFGRRIPWPVRSSLVAVDAKTGVGLRDVLALEDDSTGITSVLPSGVILNTLGTALTSGVAPLAGLAGWLLPGDLEPLLPVGGLQVSRPAGPPVGGPTSTDLVGRLAQRSRADRARDTTRRPIEVLRFAGIEDGQRVAELMAGEGFYAEVLARAVGRGGRVVAQNNARSHERYGEALASRLVRLAEGDGAGDAEEDGERDAAADASRKGASPEAEPGESPSVPGSSASSPATIESRVTPLDALDLEAESFDAVFLVQFYHDTYWMDVDRAAMNAHVFEALVPGGVFVVIDHAAASGVGADASRTLHRIEREQVEREIEAAGFRLAARSTLLENPQDDHSRNVFDPEIRGRTDRFLLRFEKPGSND